MKTNKVYCEVCGCQIKDTDKSYKIRANTGPLYDFFYICEDCHKNREDEQNEFKHVDMGDGVKL